MFELAPSDVARNSVYVTINYRRVRRIRTSDFSPAADKDMIGRAALFKIYKFDGEWVREQAWTQYQCDGSLIGSLVSTSVPLDTMPELPD